MKQEEEECHEEMRGLHFYTIISPYCLQLRRLLIPSSFIANLGCKLSSPALLKAPSSKEWQVELEERNGQFWFHNGWHDFMQHHSIHVAHFLVFRYNGNSRFSVFIFDNTASEIWYPSDADDCLVQLTDETGPHASVKHESQDEGSARSVDFDRSRKLVMGSHSNNAGSDTQVISSHQEKCRAKHVAEFRNFTLFAERQSAVVAAKRFTSIHPFFTITMRHTHVHEFFIATIPNDFARTYLKEDIKSINLRVSNERTWQVQYVVQMDRVRLTKGWKAFVLDNYLDEYDICIFELVDKRQWEFKVTLFRVQDPRSSKIIPALSKNSNCPLGNDGMDIDFIIKKRKISDSKKQIENEVPPLVVNKTDTVNFCNSVLKPSRCTSLFEKRELTEARLFTSVNPFCTVIMKPSHVHGLSGLNLPIAFVRSYLREDIQIVTLRVSDWKTWPVRYSYNNDRVRLNRGWKAFVEDNYLEEDDICIFELVDTRRWELKVTIFRTQDPKLNKRVLTPYKNKSCNSNHILGYKGPQNEVGGEKRKFSGLKEEICDEEISIIVNRDDKDYVHNTSEPITYKHLLQSRKFTPFSREEREILEARIFSSIYPYCSVIMKPSHVHGKFLLHLPIVFTRAYLKKDIHSFTLRVSDGRIWQVRCSTNNYKFILYKGWKEFVLDNYLEEDDVCFFELVGGRGRELTITIFRVQDPELRKRISAHSKMSSCVQGEVGMQNEDSGKERKVSNSKEHIKNEEVPLEVYKNNEVDLPDAGEPIIFTHPVHSSNKTDKGKSVLIPISETTFASFSKEERAILEARIFCPIHPYCSVIMKPSNVHGKFMLNLPVLFTRAYLEKDIHSVTLRVSDGRIWQLWCSADYNQFKLYKGWKEFVLDNYLEEGDVCFFELVDRKHGELNVTIFRVQDPELREIISAQSKMSSSLRGVGMQTEYSREKRKVSNSKEHIKNEDFPLVADMNKKVDVPDTGEPIIFTAPTDSSNRTDKEKSTSIPMSVLKGVVVYHEDGKMTETTAVTSDTPFYIVTMQSSDLREDFNLGHSDIAEKDWQNVMSRKQRGRFGKIYYRRRKKSRSSLELSLNQHVEAFNKNSTAVDCESSSRSESLKEHSSAWSLLQVHSPAVGTNSSVSKAWSVEDDELERALFSQFRAAEILEEELEDVNLGDCGLTEVF